MLCVMLNIFEIFSGDSIICFKTRSNLIKKTSTLLSVVLIELWPQTRNAFAASQHTSILLSTGSAGYVPTAQMHMAGIASGYSSSHLKRGVHLASCNSPTSSLFPRRPKFQTYTCRKNFKKWGKAYIAGQTLNNNQ